MSILNHYFLIVIFSFSALNGISQEYSYKHYSIKDGLVGNHVYHAAQDNAGFLWFATETGVSRFDGTNFKNFTTADGLTDNEVLNLFVDSKGRVWMLPFKNSLCYYFKGQIHNPGNDTLLRALKIKEYVETMYEDTSGNLIFIELRNVLALTKDNRVISNDRFVKNALRISGGGLNDKSSLVIHVDSSYYEVKVNPLSIQFTKKEYPHKVWGYQTSYFYINAKRIIYLSKYDNVSDNHSMVINNYIDKTNDTLKIADYNSISDLNDSEIVFNTQKGAEVYHLKQKKIISTYLNKEHVTFTFQDRESNLWFATLERGIYRLSPNGNLNIYFSNDQKVRKPVESVIVTSTDIIIGSDENSMFIFNKKSRQTRSVSLIPTISRRRIIKLKKFKDSLYILTESCLQKSDTLLNHLKVLSGTELMWSYKNLDFDSSGLIFFATHARVFSFSEKNDDNIKRVNEDNGNVNNVLSGGISGHMDSVYFVGRTTSVCYTDSGIYIGTLTGLKFINWQRKVYEFNDRFPILKGRITQLLAIGNKLWIGTNEEGIFCWDGKNNIRQISTMNGLTGNLVKVLYTDKKYLWDGSDRGLNKISLDDTLHPVLQTYTSSDGLTADMINTVYTQGDTVYVGTPEGLSLFNEKQLKINSHCNLQILGITISGKMIQYDSSKLFIKNRDNNIRFDFVGISYKSEAAVTYYYKLSGINAEWETTKENFLQYPTLPSGDYTLQLYAVNRFGVKSKEVTINFEIEKKLIETAGFIFLLILLAIFLAVILANLRIRKVKSMQMEKTANAEKIAGLEQQALKSQMNPHFIFNCLNSIQQYVMDKDVLGANRFISGFSKLIRQTLDNSGKESITVAEEESFLRSYLELEKSRFEEKFDYIISIDNRIQKDIDSLPPMLLQPYIENCIRHGIMHKSNGKGIIDIQFNLVKGKLSCIISDNGIGRLAANSYKRNRDINYQSKGTDITWQRIKMINLGKDADIILQTEDLMDANMEACGTKVTVLIPLQKAL